jgi:hypothetical protein
MSNYCSTFGCLPGLPFCGEESTASTLRVYIHVVVSECRGLDLGDWMVGSCINFIDLVSKTLDEDDSYRMGSVMSIIDALWTGLRDSSHTS